MQISANAQQCDLRSDFAEFSLCLINMTVPDPDCMGRVFISLLHTLKAAGVTLCNNHKRLCAENINSDNNRCHVDVSTDLHCQGKSILHKLVAKDKIFRFITYVNSMLRGDFTNCEEVPLLWAQIIHAYGVQITAKQKNKIINLM
jgi:hypothetical protein